MCLERNDVRADKNASMAYKPQALLSAGKNICN